MKEKVGRNDPCPCGSGKKYKSCCLGKSSSGKKHKLKATWINAPQGPNLMERAFGDAIASTGKTFNSLEEPKKENEKPENLENE
jgi:uncharacterized protein